MSIRTDLFSTETVRNAPEPVKELVQELSKSSKDRTLNIRIVRCTCSNDTYPCMCE